MQLWDFCFLWKGLRKCSQLEKFIMISTESNCKKSETKKKIGQYSKYAMDLSQYK